MQSRARSWYNMGIPYKKGGGSHAAQRVLRRLCADGDAPAAHPETRHRRRGGHLRLQPKPGGQPVRALGRASLHRGFALHGAQRAARLPHGGAGEPGHRAAGDGPRGRDHRLCLDRRRAQLRGNRLFPGPGILGPGPDDRGPARDAGVRLCPPAPQPRGGDVRRAQPRLGPGDGEVRHAPGGAAAAEALQQGRIRRRRDLGHPGKGQAVSRADTLRNHASCMVSRDMRRTESRKAGLSPASPPLPRTANGGSGQGGPKRSTGGVHAA